MQALTNVEASGSQGQAGGDLIDPLNQNYSAGEFGKLGSGSLPLGELGRSHSGSHLAAGSSSFSKHRQLLSGTKLITMGDSQERGPTSLFIFQENNFIRLKTRAIIENSIFEYSVLATIIANCVALAMEAHLPNNDKTEIAIMIVSISDK